MAEMLAYGERDGMILSSTTVEDFAQYCLEKYGITSELLPIDTEEDRRLAVEAVEGTHIDDYLNERSMFFGFSKEEVLGLLCLEATKLEGDLLSPYGQVFRTADVPQVPIIVNKLPVGTDLVALRNECYSSLAIDVTATGIRTSRN